MEQALFVYLRSAKQSFVYLADILKADSLDVMIKSYANSKTKASTFDVRRIRVFCILHFAMSAYVCTVTWQPIAYIYRISRPIRHTFYPRKM